MIQALWLKKPWKGRSKGISSVIGTIFLIIVFLAISTNIFIWAISQNSIYNQAARDINQKNADRLNENVIATEGEFTVLSGNKVKVEATLTNAGPIAAQLINVWVFDTSRQTYGCNNSIASMSGFNLSPGQVWNVTGSNAIIVTVIDATSGDDFNAWFVTARGNTVPITPYESEVEPGTGGELFGGPFALTFSNDAFQYTSDQYPTTPYPAFQIDNDRTRILFWIKFRNRADRGIQISSLSFFQVVVRELGSGGVPSNVEDERYFHIVEKTSTSAVGGLVVYNDYSQTIPNDWTESLKFGATAVSGTSFLSYPLRNGGSAGHDTYDNLLWTFLVMFWRYEPTIEEPDPPRFGQTIAYAAIRALK